jgi:hypothetical protein
MAKPDNYVPGDHRVPHGLISSAVLVGLSFIGSGRMAEVGAALVRPGRCLARCPGLVR